MFKFVSKLNFNDYETWETANLMKILQIQIV